MWNKSKIFKRAHEMAKNERSLFPRTIGVKPYRKTFSACLKGAYREAWASDQPAKSPELVALEFEHTRRNLSSSHYFGSADYRRNEQRIKELKLAA